ncbi:glycosyltransferase family 2 protein [Adlercreutzia mucosicola]|uniref:glycosyltransferase family 2 protein n=1 Tax=Adlercreutzia mucosicola TaxID=580026 RepID=UPI0004864969|nr:glycosyltransferase family 2 protein [Adlercreutzia mucosicola]MCR2034197.1 glycosyltransferase family 2 protein [Adlercreutzia mucosicola]
MNTPPPTLWIVIPCYNEAEVLPSTAPLFLTKLQSLIESRTVSPESRICFVDDGSRDETWSFITQLSAESSLIVGLALSRNRGHQNALLCGLMEARSFCDVSISIDCDGQDDIDAIDDMLARFSQGNEIVYGVRSARDTDTPFKRKTAESFYRFMQKMGAEVVFNHADFRLMGKTALDGLSQFGEKNLFLRGIVPLIGFQSTTVEYERSDRVAGKSHYPFAKMAHLALDGITSLSVKPIHLISTTGIIFGCVGLIGLVWALATFASGNSIPGWTSTLSAIFLIGGLQLLSIGVIGEYIGKIYLESKDRPRYLIKERVGF